MSKMENKFNRKQQIKYTTKPFNVSKLVEALILVDTFNILQSTTRRPELWEKYDKKKQESTRWTKRTYVLSFMGEKVKWSMWSVKLMTRSGIKGSRFLLTGDI